MYTICEKILDSSRETLFRSILCAARYSRSSTLAPSMYSIMSTLLFADITSGMYKDVLMFSKFFTAFLAFLASLLKSSSLGRFSRISSPSHVNSNSGNHRFIQPPNTLRQSGIQAETNEEIPRVNSTISISISLNSSKPGCCSYGHEYRSEEMYVTRPAHLDRYSLPGLLMVGNVNLSQTSNTDRLGVEVVKDFGQRLPHI